MLIACPPPAAAMFSPGQATLVAVILLAITLMSVSRSRRRRDVRETPQEVAREQISRLKEQKAVQSDVAELTLQLQQFGRETTTQLDNKLTRLERVIADADQRIARLQRLLHPSGDQSMLDVTVGDELRGLATASPESSEVRDHRNVIQAGSIEGRPAVEIARELGRSVEEVELTLAVHGRRSGFAAAERV